MMKTVGALLICLTTCINAFVVPNALTKAPTTNKSPAAVQMVPSTSLVVGDAASVLGSFKGMDPIVIGGASIDPVVLGGAAAVAVVAAVLAGGQSTGGGGSSSSSSSSSGDLSIPYDAAAKFAYESSDKTMSFADFKDRYEADAVYDATVKRAVREGKEPPERADAYNLSIPYDAAAKYAYENSPKTLDFDKFKTKYKSDAVKLVIKKKKARDAKR